ncbi:MAG: 8-oxo-dGTP diphosphatase [Candidatus Micrarchaeota archaeon]
MAIVQATVVCIQNQKEGKTLMLHRKSKANDFHKGRWAPPGGKCEPNESPLRCAVRELKEESGILLLNPKLVGIFHVIGLVKDFWDVYAYTATSFRDSGLDITTAGKLAWIDDSKLTSLPQLDGNRIVMQNILDRKYFEITLYYHGDDLVHCSPLLDTNLAKFLQQTRGTGMKDRMGVYQRIRRKLLWAEREAERDYAKKLVAGEMEQLPFRFRYSYAFSLNQLRPA